jgi:hypothetical protein
MDSDKAEQHDNHVQRHEQDDENNAWFAAQPRASRRGFLRVLPGLVELRVDWLDQCLSLWDRHGGP